MYEVSGSDECTKSLLHLNPFYLPYCVNVSILKLQTVAYVVRSWLSAEEDA
jgi:hypothetical protein